MKRSVISSVALTAAMLLSTSAFAQTMVMGTQVSAEDLPKVQAACDTLAAKAKAEGGASNSEDKTTAETPATPPAETPATPPAEAPAVGDVTANVQTSVDASAGKTDAGVNAATTTSIDLALLSYEECQKAGLVQ